MPAIRVKENEPFEVAMRRFKRARRKNRSVDRTARP